VPSFNVDAALRWARFDPRRRLRRRSDGDLPFVDERFLVGSALLLDTCVYIDQMQDKSPAILDQLLEFRPASHSTVAIQELMHAAGVLDPDDSRTPAAVEAIRRAIRAMPPHRIHVPDAEVLCRAALLAGILCRLQGYGGGAKVRALHDCVLFLQGQKLGLTILTANIRDFDCLLQLVPAGRALFYRRR
jgi:hypothetical protein